MEFPDAEAIRVINKLWSHYGNDAGCRSDLDQLYPKVVEGLDAVAPYWFPTPRLNGIGRIQDSSRVAGRTQEVHWHYRIIYGT